VINPKTILAEWVTALQSCPDLVTAVGGDGNNIRAFMEGLATDNNLRLAILQMPPGSILVCLERHHAAASHGRCTALRAPILDLLARAGAGFHRHLCRPVLAVGERDKGYKDVAELLLAKGADLNAKANNGATPAAIMAGRVSVPAPSPPILLQRSRGTFRGQSTDLPRPSGGSAGGSLRSPCWPNTRALIPLRAKAAPASSG
jgi:hypothetical protein